MTATIAANGDMPLQYELALLKDSTALQMPLAGVFAPHG
jgi:hypothetical protein